MTELRNWQFTSDWQQRWTEWMSPGGHGSIADVRNDKLAWTPLTKPLAQCNITLLTSGGVHLRAQNAYDVSKKDGDWSWRPIPSDTPTGALAITHTHYNHLDADRDVNCMLPIDRLRELRDQGVIDSARFGSRSRCPRQSRGRRCHGALARMTDLPSVRGTDTECN
jgi:Glycine/sarcosine/betaine reductase selenoprotein B (GRDB)